jgi:hypothetical protein
MIFAVSMAIGVRYRTNDDVDMRMIAETQIGDGSQTEFLLYQNAVMGKVLKALYQWQSSIPWYDIELAGCAALGAILGLFGVLRVCRSRAYVMLVLTLSVVILLPIFSAFQFTASAMMLSGGSILLFLSIWRSRPVKPFDLALANGFVIICFFVGSLVRFHAAAFCLLALVPLVVLIRPRPTVKFALSQIAVLIVAVSISAAAVVYNESYYANAPGWTTFWKDARVRASAWQYASIDYANSEAFQRALSSVNWTQNDYKLLGNWLYMNQDVFSRDRMAVFANHIPQLSSVQKAENTYNVLIGKEGRLPLFAFLCIAPIAAGLSIGALVSAIAAIGWFISLLFITGVVFKSGLAHILWPFYAVCILGSCLLIVSQKDVRSRYRSGLAVVAVLVGILFCAGLEIRQAVRNAALDNDMRKAIADDLNAWSLSRGAIVVVWNNNFPFEVWARPFHSMSLGSVQLLHTNDVSVSPHSDGIYSILGTRDVAWALCHRPDVVMVDARLGYASSQAEMLKTYMREHYNESVAVKQLHDGKSLTLYSCYRS